MCVAERGQRETHVLLRGNPNLPGDKVEPGVPEVLGAAAPTFVNGPGKRRALADWLTDRQNPRTARVMANRIWQYHFGRGIVPTPNDFGGLGEAADAPRAPRLAGGRAHGRRLAAQADAPADRALERLPDGVARVEGRAGRRPGEPLVLAVPDAPAHRRGGSRLDPGRQRQRST